MPARGELTDAAVAVITPLLLGGGSRERRATRKGATYVAESRLGTKRE